MRMPVRRLIPARAGKTLEVPAPGEVPGAHPRSRGENRRRYLRWTEGAGSSPLARGKLTSASMERAPRRLIPARAGKTRPLPWYVSIGGAHPRSRGENPTACPGRYTEWGSSPLARGKPRLNGGQRRRRGLIPARAGKTNLFHATLRVFAAHPRSRGENEDRLVELKTGRGSSPLARGKPKLLEKLTKRPRLIPARAGKTTRRL